MSCLESLMLKTILTAESSAILGTPGWDIDKWIYYTLNWSKTVLMTFVFLHLTNPWCQSDVKPVWCQTESVFRSGHFEPEFDLHLPWTTPHPLFGRWFDFPAPKAFSDCSHFQGLKKNSACVIHRFSCNLSWNPWIRPPKSVITQGPHFHGKNVAKIPKNLFSEEKSTFPARWRVMKKIEGHFQIRHSKIHKNLSITNPGKLIK